MIRILISLLLLMVGFNLMIHSFNYEPILGVVVTTLFTVTIYFIIKPLFKKTNEKSKLN